MRLRERKREDGEQTTEQSIPGRGGGEERKRERERCY